MKEISEAKASQSIGLFIRNEEKAMYRFFYNRAAIGDILIVVMNPEARVDHKKELGNIVALYDEKDTLVGINIFNIGEVMKIKVNGVIMIPDEKMLEIINNLLTKEGLEALPALTESGYKVALVTKVEEHPLDEKAQILELSCGDDKYETVSSYPNVKVGSKVVVATDGTILYDGSLFHKAIIRNINNDVLVASAPELRIEGNANEAFLLDDEPSFKEGEDFFLR